MLTLVTNPRQSLEMKKSVSFTDKLIPKVLINVLYNYRYVKSRNSHA